MAEMSLSKFHVQWRTKSSNHFLHNNLKIELVFVHGDAQYSVILSGCKLDCSQPSIFSYFYSIVEHAYRIARELNISAKGRLDWVGGGDPEKQSPPFLQKRKIPIG